MRSDRLASFLIEEKVIAEIQKELNYYMHRTAAELSSDSSTFTVQHMGRVKLDRILSYICIHRMLCYTYPSLFHFLSKYFFPFPIGSAFSPSSHTPKSNAPPKPTKNAY
jgi:hypothetical protein